MLTTEELDAIIRECRLLAPGCVVRENTDDWEGSSYDFFLSAVDEQNNTVYLNSSEDPTIRSVWEKALNKLRNDVLLKLKRSTSISSDPDHLKVLETLVEPKRAFSEDQIPVPCFHKDSPIKALLEQPIVNRGRVVVLKETQVAGTHYKDLVIEPAEYCHKNKFQFCESEAIKYLSRFRKKKHAEDLKKAHHFISMILEMEYKIVSEITYTEKPENLP
jgi:hypothetical protein